MLTSNSRPFSRVIPFSVADRARAEFAGSWWSSLSLEVRLWKILLPFVFSSDAPRDSLEPTTVDFCDSVDMRDRAVPLAVAVPVPATVDVDGVCAVREVDSPLGGDEDDVRVTTALSVLREIDLLLRDRWDCTFVNASMCANTAYNRGGGK